MFEKGDIIHIVERLYFKDDIRRHFCGEIIDFNENLLRARGYVWVFDTLKNEFTRKRSIRDRVFSLSNRLTINILPKDVDPGKINYIYNDEEGHTVSDGKTFSISINEFGLKH